MSTTTLHDRAWETEAALVADFAAYADHAGWTAYHETAGWDLLISRRADGFQVGIEAKLSLNAKVLCQVLEHGRWDAEEGPDCHAILVPAPKSVSGLETIAGRLGITVIQGASPQSWRRWKGPSFHPELPDAETHWMAYWREEWPEQCPDRRCRLPDYVPDVVGGKSAPVALTPWKIAAIKAAVIMERRGRITRADFKALGISASRWTQFWLLSDGDGGWLPTEAMPDFASQHPVNYAQIKADFDKWAPPALPQTPRLFGDAA